MSGLVRNNRLGQWMALVTCQQPIGPPLLVYVYVFLLAFALLGAMWSVSSQSTLVGCRYTWYACDGSMLRCMSAHLALLGAITRGVRCYPSQACLCPGGAITFITLASSLLPEEHLQP
jgi:hypothetical protein